MGNKNSGRDAWIWTPEREASLRELWANRGESASAIGEAIGVSRCAVLGKAARLGLPKRKGKNTPRKPVKIGSHHPPRPKRERPPRPEKPTRMPPLPKREVPTGKAWEPLLGTVPRPLIDLRDGMCKWPVSENSPFLFCAASVVEGKSYCQHHLNWSIGQGTNFERAAIRTARSISRFEFRDGERARELTSR